MTLMRTIQVNPAEEPFAMLSGKEKDKQTNTLKVAIFGLGSREKTEERAGEKTTRLKMICAAASRLAILLRAREGTGDVAMTEASVSDCAGPPAIAVSRRLYRCCFFWRRPLAEDA